MKSYVKPPASQPRQMQEIPRKDRAENQAIKTGDDAGQNRLQALANNSHRANSQGALQAMADNSPRAKAQGKFQALANAGIQATAHPGQFGYSQPSVQATQLRKKGVQQSRPSGGGSSTITNEGSRPQPPRTIIPPANPFPDIGYSLLSSSSSTGSSSGHAVPGPTALTSQSLFSGSTSSSSGTSFTPTPIPFHQGFPAHPARAVDESSKKKRKRVDESSDSDNDHDPLQSIDLQALYSDESDEDGHGKQETAAPESLSESSSSDEARPQASSSATYSDDETEEVSAPATRKHYIKRIVDDLKDSKDYHLESSDSADALDAEHLEASKKKRLQIKLAELKAIARQSRPLTAQEIEKQKEFQAQREADYAERKGKRRKYSRNAQEKYIDLAEKFKSTSFLHNSLLRRAFRHAIPNSKIQEGGSKNYDQSQGKIRKKLQPLIKKQMNEFSEGDFSDPDDYHTLQHIGKYCPSNDKKARRLHDAISSGDNNDKKASTLFEFHHIGFKESDKRIGEHSLNPANLTLLFGERTKNGSSRPHGGHQEAHDLQGFQPAGKKGKTWHGRGKGGVFKNMDAEGTHYITRHVAKKRASKSELYRVNAEDRGYEADSDAHVASSSLSSSSMSTPSSTPSSSSSSTPTPSSSSTQPPATSLTLTGQSTAHAPSAPSQTSLEELRRPKRRVKRRGKPRPAESGQRDADD